MTRRESLVLAGHGSQHHPEAAAQLLAHAEAIRERDRFDEVHAAFWKDEPALHDVRSLVSSDVAYVVPVLTSEGYFAEDVFPRELGVEAPDRRDDGPDLRYAEPVGTHPGLADAVDRRVLATADAPAGEVGVALVGHGTERNDRSGRATRRHAERLRERGRYAAVEALFLDEAPRVGTLMAELDAPELVVVPLFVANGHHVTRDIPAALDHPGVGTSATIDGRLVHVTDAVGSDPRIADVVIERAREAGARAEHSPRPARSDAASAFLGAVESAGGPFEWGELAVSRWGEGFGLRHVTDVDEGTASLEPIPGPGALRRHVRRDDGGRYRPLSGARSLPTGWSLEGLGAIGLVRAVGAVYPGSVELWYRERTGRLSPTGFEETARRQSGRYEDLVGLTGDGVAAATEAVCGTCVRTPRWRTSAERAPRRSEGGGEIPCREACPFFLAAANAFVDSDGRAADEVDSGVPAGALHSPGNEYRVRFARALGRRGDRSPARAAGGGDR